MLQGNSEQRRVQLRLDSVEEGSLRLGLDSVDGAESKTKQTVVVLVVDELLADLGGSLNRLGGGRDTTNDDGVLVDVTASRALVAVLDGPGVASQLGSIAARLVEAVARGLGGRQLRGENPASFVCKNFDIANVSIADDDSNSRTYRSADPVSKSKFKVVPPTLTGVRYSSSLF